MRNLFVFLNLLFVSGLILSNTSKAWAESFPEFHERLIATWNGTELHLEKRIRVPGKYKPRRGVEKRFDLWRYSLLDPKGKVIFEGTLQSSVQLRSFPKRPASDGDSFSGEQTLNKPIPATITFRMPSLSNAEKIVLFKPDTQNYGHYVRVGELELLQNIGGGS